MLGEIVSSSQLPFPGPIPIACSRIDTSQVQQPAISVLRLETLLTSLSRVQEQMESIAGDYKKTASRSSPKAASRAFQSPKLSMTISMNRRLFRLNSHRPRPCNRATSGEARGDYITAHKVKASVGHGQMPRFLPFPPTPSACYPTPKPMPKLRQ